MKDEVELLFDQFREDLQAICRKYNAAVIPVKGRNEIQIKFEIGGVVHDGGRLLGVTPGRCLYAYASDARGVV